MGEPRITDHRQGAAAARCVGNYATCDQCESDLDIRRLEIDSGERVACQAAKRLYKAAGSRLRVAMEPLLIAP